MRITWEDGVTTLAAVGAVVLERAYFHNWDWPLVSSTRWVVVGVAALGAVGFIFSYVIDKFTSRGWTLAAVMLGVVTVALAGLGLIFATSDYVVLLMLTVVALWLVSAARHLTLPSPTWAQKHA